MLKHFLKVYWKLIGGLSGSIGLLVTIIINWKSIKSFLDTLIDNMLQKLDISTELLIILFGI